MSSRAIKPLSKPWMATEMDYLKHYRAKTFEEGDPSGGYAKYSEFQKPYAYDEDVPEDYMWWEFIWPDFPPISYPDPVETDPCEVSENCTFAKIIGSDKLRCGHCETWTQMHQWIGCTIAPWWAAFGVWEIIDPPRGVEIQTQGPVMVTVCAEDDADDGDFTLKYLGPLDCVDEKVVELEDCGCCKEFTITGQPTVNPGAQWVGTVYPSCQEADCSVVSNSGCTLSCSMDGAGAEVYVTPGIDDCGSFTVTVEYEKEDCITKSFSIAVRINNAGGGPDASWEIVIPRSMDVCEDLDPDCDIPCVSQWGDGDCKQADDLKFKYGTSYAPATSNCQGTIYRHCSGCVYVGCDTPVTNMFPPPLDCVDGSSGDIPWVECSVNETYGICDPIPLGWDKSCNCSRWVFDKCEWRCTC